MFRALARTEAEIDDQLNTAFEKAYNEPGLTDEEMYFYKGVAKAIEWMVDIDVADPDYEDAVE